ncbi:MAG: HlyD family efflux transporter periplasmic adaptor subunit [Betaproteobacteria bacterium]|nr:HlyD family efflux transporter periplasmic adaptor subunit [Betaproteobacteria bacterium]
MKYPQHLELCFACALALVAAGCTQADHKTFAGYAEGEYVRVASPYAGSLATLSVKRGDRIANGAALFALEQENERAAREEAAARVRQAESQLENSRKGKRPEEVAAVRAQLAQAEASLQLSAADLKRTQDLVASKFLSPSKLDEAKSAQERDRSRVAELNAQLKVVQLTAGRSDEIAALQSEVKAAREQLAQAEWRLAQKSQRAPKAALVADTLYTQGEWVQAGMPVVSLLPAENIKLKFFVPETQVGTVKIGQDVTVSCDGCTPLTAKVSFVSPQAEYTSPLIYSKENRASLVFAIEARAKPEDAVKLHPGQPVEVKL